MIFTASSGSVNQLNDDFYNTVGVAVAIVSDSVTGRDGYFVSMDLSYSQARSHILQIIEIRRQPSAIITCASIIICCLSAKTKWQKDNNSCSGFSYAWQGPRR